MHTFTMPPHLHFLKALHRSLAAGPGDVLSAPDPLAQAAALARRLHALWPSAPLATAYLPGPGQPACCVLDHQGVEQPTWGTAVASLLADRPPSPHRDAAPLTLAINRPGPGHCLLACALPDSPLPAVLGVGLPPSTPAEDTDTLGTTLSVLALGLADQLRSPPAAQALAGRAGLTALATRALIAGPLAHELNNFLNASSLQIAVLESQVPEARRADLRSIRKQARNMGGLIQQWQQYHEGQLPSATKVDLNALVSAHVARLARQQAGPPSGPDRQRVVGVEHASGEGMALQRLHLELAPDLPEVPGVPLYLETLLEFLLTNMARSPALKGEMTLGTEAGEGKVSLRLRCTTEGLSPGQVGSFFNPLGPGLPDACQLEMATCESIARRRLGGSIAVTERSPGEIEVLVALPLNPR